MADTKQLSGTGDYSLTNLSTHCPTNWRLSLATPIRRPHPGSFRSRGTGKDPAASQQLISGYQLEINASRQLFRLLRVYEQLDADKVVVRSVGVQQQAGWSHVRMREADDTTDRLAPAQYLPRPIIRGTEGGNHRVLSRASHPSYSRMSTIRSRPKSSASMYAACPIPSRLAMSMALTAASSSRSKMTTRPGKCSSSVLPHCQAASSLAANHLPGPQLFFPGRSTPLLAISSHSESSMYLYHRTLQGRAKCGPSQVSMSVALLFPASCLRSGGFGTAD